MFLLVKVFFFLCIGGGYYNKHEKERKIM